MRKIFFAALVIISFASSAQTWTGISGKYRYTINLGIPVKIPGALTAADSAQIIINPVDSSLYFVYKGSWRKAGVGGTDTIRLITTDSIIVLRKIRLPFTDTTHAVKSKGAVIYDTILNHFYGYTNAAWGCFDCSGGGSGGVDTAFYSNDTLYIQTPSKTFAILKEECPISFAEVEGDPEENTSLANAFALKENVIAPGNSYYDTARKYFDGYKTWQYFDTSVLKALGITYEIFGGQPYYYWNRRSNFIINRNNIGNIDSLDLLGGLYRYNSGTTGAKPGTSGGGTIWAYGQNDRNHINSTDRASQLVIDNNGQLWTRTSNSGTWGAWVTPLYSGDLGSYLPTTGGTLTGYLTIQNKPYSPTTPATGYNTLHFDVGGNLRVWNANGNYYRFDTAGMGSANINLPVKQLNILANATGTPGATTFLRGDGTWITPSEGSYLPLTGGTINGYLTFQNKPSSPSTPSVGFNTFHFDAAGALRVWTATGNYYRFDTTGMGEGNINMKVKLLQLLGDATGTPSASTYLRGDGAWITPSVGGSGTVTSGAANRVAYYPAIGTTVDNLPAITANRALISDANGLPTHSSVTNTELAYVSGVTSAIQTQINGKQASGSYLVTTNNLSDVSNAGTARTNLGGTTAGQNIFTLSNPSAIRYIKINADNTVTARTAAEMLSDIGAQASGSYQTSDADLTAIAGISPSNDDIIQRKSGAWTNRTMAQLKTDLALVKGDVSLGNVDNTSDATKMTASATMQNKNLDNTNTAVLKDNSFALQDDGDVTKQLVFQLSGITTGTNRSLTVPNASTTIVGTDVTQTLTNKTIAAGSNTISGITNSHLSGSAGITNANLANSTISGVSLGSNLNDLTISTGLQLNSGSTYNGSAARTLTIDNTVATLTGSQTLTNKTIAAGSNTISGLTNSNLSGSAGITNANLSNSTISGIALGSSLTDLTAGSGIAYSSGTTYNGGTARTITVSGLTNSHLSGTAGITAANLSYTSQSILANNTGSTAAPSAIIYKNVTGATYSGTADWDGTDPTGATVTYDWQQIGDKVMLLIRGSYSSAGASNTTLTLTLPSDCPNPVDPSGRGASSTRLYAGSGGFATSLTGALATNCRVWMGVNSGDTGWQVVVIGNSSAANSFEAAVPYTAAP